MRPFFLLTIFITALLHSKPSLGAADEPYNLSYSSEAFAPNAGGQEAHSLRLAHTTWEGHFFLNKSLYVGQYPLTGVGYDYRFNLCKDCFWKFFVQAGAGLSNGGIYGELLWGTTIPLLPIWLPMEPPRYVPFIRLDFATHLIFGQVRPNTWSYPLWLGIGVPF